MSKALTTAPESEHGSNAAGAARVRNQRGDLQRTLLPRLLLRLYRERFCGTLILNHEPRERLFLFERGAPFSFSTRVPSESLGSHLVERGILSPAEREQALRATRDGIRQQRHGALAPADVDAEREDAVERVIAGGDGVEHGLDVLALAGSLADGRFGHEIESRGGRTVPHRARRGARSW